MKNEASTPAPDSKPAKTKTWRKTAVEGLYEDTRSGVYYSRFSMNGKPTFRSLRTKAYSVAKVLHSKAAAQREVARQKGATLNHELNTLSALADELDRRIGTNTSDAVTKQNQRFAIARIRQHWPTSPSKTLARNIGLDAIIEFRQRLAEQAQHHRGGSPNLAKGYKAGTVNQTLTVLRMMLGIAVEKHVIATSPFHEKATLQESLFLPRRSRRPQLPSRSDMERVFAEMLHMPDGVAENNGRSSWQQSRVRHCQEHARFIAYSGLRVSEANAVTFADDLGDQLRVRGPEKEEGATLKEYHTKTESSERMVPIHPLLRSLMNTIKERCPNAPATKRFLSVETSLNALERTCKRLNLPKLTHHDLRHYFATICIENGVDIPTVSRWLGHSDGGSLAMKTYGHLRQEHSIASMKRVSFAPQAVQSISASPAPGECPAPAPVSPA